MKPLLILSQPYRFFFPLAALHTAIAVLLWIAALSGWIQPTPNPSLWHAHEMLFGFAAAVIAGFVLTAAENWTGLRTTTPLTLAALLTSWLVARLTASFSIPEWPIIPLLANGLFLAMLTILVSRVVLVSGNWRNVMFIPFLLGLTAINLGVNFCLTYGYSDAARLLLTFTVYLIRFLMVFMGGRVIPFFTGRRLGYQPLQRRWLNWTSTVRTLSQ